MFLTLILSTHAFFPNSFIQDPFEGPLLDARYSFELPKDARAELCENFEDPDWFRRRILKPYHRIYFRNPPIGVANGGVCWWHSRLQRSATYLSVMRPDLPRPTEDEAWDILMDLRKNRRVVEIPGYRSFRSFTRAWQPLIHDFLERWQLFDAFIKQSWINGLWGRTKVSSRSLRRKLEALYEEVEGKGHITYQKLQMRGITAHSWLVVGMDQLSDGYDLHVVDSNFLSIKRVPYRFGDKTQRVELPGYSDHAKYIYGQFVGYTQQRWDLREYEDALRDYCL